MKKKLHLFLCVMALSVLPLWADEAPKSATVEQRIRETDLSIALQQYERVRMDLFETKLKMELLDADEDLTQAARKKQAELLARRSDILQRNVDELRAQLREIAIRRGETEVAKAK